MSARKGGKKAAEPAQAALTVDRPMQLGFAVKVLGQTEPELKSNDARRWQSDPHLRVSLGYLHEIFSYLDRVDIRMYRMSSDIAPYATHPDMPQFHRQIAECDADLRALGKRAKELRLRLSFHPSQFVVMNSPDPVLVKKSAWDLESQVEMLDRMELGPEAVVIIHTGGVYGERENARERWVRAYESVLSDAVRRRLVLENDDVSFSAADVLWIHDRCGVPLIFDFQHFWCLNPQGLELRPTVERFIRSWRAGVRPKIHLSSPCTELKERKRKNRKTGKLETVIERATWTSHADYNNPFEVATLLRTLAGLEFDIMLEAKRKDLALLRLRGDLVRYAPDVAARFGLHAEEKSALLDEPSVEETPEAGEEEAVAVG